MSCFLYGTIARVDPENSRALAIPQSSIKEAIMSARVSQQEGQACFFWIKDEAGTIIKTNQDIQRELRYL